MKVLRFQADVETDDPRFVHLWEAGCCGLQQDGPDVLATFPEVVNVPVEGTWEDADSTDYVGRYQADLSPVAVGPLVVAPTHRHTTLEAYQRVVWLDPGLAFGSGHHATTRMALAALVDADPWDREVLDVGTGSGVLAIAAAVLGASHVVGVDIDPQAVEVARVNAERNKVRGDWRVGSIDAVEGRHFDTVVANLYAELHAELAQDYVRVMRPGSVLIVTGILDQREDLVKRALGSHLRLLGRQQDDEWVCLQWCKD